MDEQFKNRGVLKLQPHDHACLIYESESEWRDNVIPFIIAGLKQGEKCVYGLNHRSRQYILDCLREEGINVAAYEESGQLLILDKSVLPVESDGDRLGQMQDFYIQYLEKWLAEGYPAIRFTSESLYNLIGIESTKNMVEVNSRMNTMLFPHYPCAALCQYDRFKTDPKLLKYAILSHPIVIKNNELYVNLASIPDERFLEITSDRWEAEHWLAVIERENREMEKLQMVNHTLNNSSQPLLCFQADGSVMACNKGFYQLMDRSGQSIQHLGEMEPYWREYLTEIIQELQQTGTHRYEREWPLPGGGRMVVDLSILEGFDNFGKLAYYFVSLSDVTGQKEAQEALRRSEEHFRLMAENAYDMISIIDRETFQHKYLSPSHERIVGYKAEELLGKSCLMHVYPEDIKSVIKKLQEGIKKGSDGTQYRAHNKDGANLWLDSFGKVIETGAFKGDILLITRDITEGKKAEIALRNSEEKYRLITENAYDMIGIIDPVTLVFKYASPSYSRASGHPMEEFVNSDSFKYIHPEDIEGLKQKLHQLLKGGNHHAQYRAQHRNGTYLWLDTIGKTIEEGEFKGNILLITRDITERKKAEITLRSSEEKYRLIADNASDGISIVDSLTLIGLYQNPALKEMLGYSENVILNTPLFEFVHPEELTLAEEKIKEGLGKGGGSMKCRLRKNDGSYIWVEINGRVMHKDSDNPLLLFIHRDISQRKRIEEKLIASEARLRHSEQELKQRLDYLNYLINSMNEVFITYALNHRITFVNSAVYKQLGYQPEELLGSNVIDFIIPPRQRENGHLYWYPSTRR